MPIDESKKVTPHLLRFRFLSDPCLLGPPFIWHLGVYVPIYCMGVISDPF